MMAEPERIIKRICFIILGIILAVFVAKQLTGLINTPMETELALAVTEEESIETECYIMRSERVLTTLSGGTMFAAAKEGERVSSGTEVIRVYQQDDYLDTEHEARRIDDQIDVLERSTVDTAYVTPDFKKMDNEIEELINDIAVYGTSGDLKGVISRKDDLLIELNKRWLFSNPGKNFKNTIDQLESKKESLESRLSGSYTSVITEMSGYYSSNVDGYENLFSSDKIENITTDEFLKLTEAVPETYHNNVAGKIITDHKWYIACPVSIEQAAFFNIGDKYPIDFQLSYEKNVEMMLDRKLEENGENKAILFFSTTVVPEGFDYTRSQKVKIAYNSHRGLKIPRKAIRVLDDNTTGVYVVSGTEVEFKRIKEIYSTDEYYIVSMSPEDYSYVDEYAPKDSEDNKDENSKNKKEKKQKYRAISLYDNVIVKGKDIYHGKKTE